MAAAKRREAFLEERRERLAAGLARVDHTRTLREEQVQRLRAKGRDVQRRLEMANVGRKQRLQSTTEKCSERVAHAKAVAARLRQKENELRNMKMQKYIDHLHENEMRRLHHLRRRSNNQNDAKENSNTQTVQRSPVKMDTAQAAVAIQRWWRAVFVKRAATNFRSAVPRTLIRLLRGQTLEKLTFPMAQQLVSLPVVTKATQDFLCQLGKVCPDLRISDQKATRDARLLLSSLITTLFPSQVLEQQGAAEQNLVACSQKMFTSFSKLVGLRKSVRRTRLMMFTANWLHFRGVFLAWKRQDSVRLLANFREHWLQLAAFKRTVMSDEGIANSESQAQWLPSIELQQQEILRRVRQVTGQTGVNEFLASITQHQPSSPLPAQADAVHECPTEPGSSGSGLPASASSGSSSETGAVSSSSQDDSCDQSGSSGSEQASSDSPGGSGGGGDDNSPQQRSPAAAAASALQSSSIDVMAIAQNLELAHELVLDENFSLKKAEAEPGSLLERVQVNMKAAFWDILREQLKQDPPVFHHVLSLLEEVKENLKATLPCRQVTSMHNEIDAGLDIELIKQQMEQGTLNIKSLALFVLSVMSRTCAPVRDADVQCIKQSLESERLDIPDIFRKILDLLSVMKLDLANHELHSIRPILLQHAAQYERTKFQELFPDAPASGIEHATAWLRDAQQNCAIANAGQPHSSPLAVLQQAFTDLVTKPPEHIPETWWLDTTRLATISSQLHCCVVVQSIAVLAGGVLGHKLATNAEFLDGLRDTLFILLDDGTMSSSAVQAAEDNIIAQVVSSADGYRKDHGLSSVDDVLRHQLEVAVGHAFSEENPVRNVLSRRLVACVRQAVSQPLNGPLPEIPPALQLVAGRLQSVLKSFARLAAYNQKVFGPVYSSALQRLFST